MADIPPPITLSLSAEPPIDKQQEMAREGETTHFHSCNSIQFENVSLDFTKEEWILLSSEQTKKYRDVILKNSENLCQVVFYFNKPVILSESQEQDRMDREITSDLCSGMMIPLKFQQAQLSQNSLQPETQNLKEESAYEHILPEYNSIGETMCTEVTIGQSMQMGSGEQSHSWYDSEVNTGEFSQGRPQKDIHNEEVSKEEDENEYPSDIITFVIEQDINEMEAKCYECKDCGKFLSSFTQLMEHKKSYTMKQVHKCSQCDRIFLCPTALQLHLKVHTDNKQYKCNTCGKCFSTNSNFKRHATIHTGEKPYECPECKKTFRHSCLLTQHKRIHSEQKQYQCDECGIGFHRRDHLTRHKLIHSRGQILP
ncbi:zinc finger protein 26-like isoform 1-T2 [Thomomys bottae]